MSLIDRTGQVWRTRTCFRTMYHPSGVNKLSRYSYYVITQSRAFKWDDFESTHHDIVITHPNGEVWYYSIIENPEKSLEKRFEFMGKRVT